MLFMMMAALLLRGLAMCFLAGLAYVVINPWHRWRYRHIPGPSYTPVFGNLPEFRRGSHEFMAACKARYGPVFKIWLGHRPMVVVADPELGRRVNYKLINRPRRLGDPLVRGPLTRDENKGLFFSRGDHWRALHRIWQPVFYADSVRATAPHMVSVTRAWLARLDDFAGDGAAIDIWREIGNLTLGIVGSAAYGIDFHTVDRGSSSAGGAAAAAADGSSGGGSSSGSASPAGSSSGPGTPRSGGSGGSSSSTAEAAARLTTLAARLQGSTMSTRAAAAIDLDGGDVGGQIIDSAKTLFAAAAGSSGSLWQLLSILAPAAARGAINLAAHALPDARFRAVLGARLTLAAASMSLIERERLLLSAAASPPAPANAAAAGAGAAEAAADVAKQAEGAGGGKAVRRTGAIAPGSFLGMLMAARDRAGHGLTDFQLMMQANTFTLAGYETTANTLAFTVFCLATHAGAEARVLREIAADRAARRAEAAALKEAGQAPVPWYAAGDLEQRFPYLCACVSEALRLYPPGASTTREVGDDAPMQLGEHLLPAGSSVVVATYVMQRDPEVWPRAAEFLPERWLLASGEPGAELLQPTTPHAYLPFGSGGRTCIGQRFALQEVRLGLVELLQRFSFEVCWPMMAGAPEAAAAAAAAGTKASGSGEQQEQPAAAASGGGCGRTLRTVNNFTLSPAGGIWVRLHKRPGAPPLDEDEAEAGAIAAASASVVAH